VTSIERMLLLAAHESAAVQRFHNGRQQEPAQAGTYLLGSAMSSSVTAQGKGGTHPCTACEKGAVLMSFSSRSTCRTQTVMLTFSKTPVSLCISQP